MPSQRGGFFENQRSRPFLILFTRHNPHASYKHDARRCLFSDAQKIQSSVFCAVLGTLKPKDKRCGATTKFASIISLFVCYLLFSLSVFGQEIPAESLQEDFQIMRHALEEAHGGIYRYTSKAEMDRNFDRAYRKINSPMTDLEFWRLVAPVVAQIKCGHTSVWVPETVQTQLETTIPLFPLAVRVFRDHAYIYRDCSNAGSLLEGSELLSINGVPVKKLLAKLEAVITGDGNTTAAKAWRIGNAGGFTVYLYALGIRSPFRVVYRRTDGKQQTTVLAGMEMPENQKAWLARNPSPKMNADLQFLDEDNIAVLTIRHFYQYVDSERKVTLQDFLQKSFEQIHERGSSNLIIDLRDNGGGLDAPGKQLFSYLWNQPFLYDKDLVINAREFDFFKYAPDAKAIPADLVERQADGNFHFVKHPNWGLQHPGQPYFGGRVFALMNGGSFSTSCEFLSMLHFHKRGTFIGEEAGGGYYGCTAGRFYADVTLPNSKLVLHVGLVTYYQAVSGYKYPDRGVIPDYPVTHTISDLLADRDRDMELALSLARKK